MKGMARWAACMLVVIWLCNANASPSPLLPSLPQQQQQEQSDKPIVSNGGTNVQNDIPTAPSNAKTPEASSASQEQVDNAHQQSPLQQPSQPLNVLPAATALVNEASTSVTVSSDNGAPSVVMKAEVAEGSTGATDAMNPTQRTISRLQILQSIMFPLFQKTNYQCILSPKAKHINNQLLTSQQSLKRPPRRLTPRSKNLLRTRVRSWQMPPKIHAIEVFTSS